jgi:hypothetical protein
VEDVFGAPEVLCPSPLSFVSAPSPAFPLSLHRNSTPSRSSNMSGGDSTHGTWSMINALANPQPSVEADESSCTPSW